MFKKFLYVSCFALISMPAFADAVSDGITVTSETLNFGKFAQINGERSTIKVSPGGGDPVLSGAVTSSSYAYYQKASEGQITFTESTENNSYDNSTKKVLLQPTSSVSVSHCSATINNITFSNKDNIIGGENSSTVTTGVGATLELAGYCKEGSYSGSILVSYDYIVGEGTENPVSHSRAVRVPYSFEVEEPLAASADPAGMNFGMWIAPSAEAKVVLYPAQSREPTVIEGAMTQIGSNHHPAMVTVQGVGGRSVSVTVPETEYLYLGGTKGNGTESLEISDITFASSSTDCLYDEGGFDLPGTNDPNAKCNFYVGATLKVHKNPTPGTYSGHINVTFIYTY